MGLQFIDENGTERTLTVEDMKTDAFKEAYYDLFKSLHGIKPRWETCPEVMLHFFDNYEAEMEAELQRERDALKIRSERDGVEYASWSHYYELKEARDEAEWQAEQAKLSAEIKERQLRGGILDTIEDWEHGSSV